MNASLSISIYKYLSNDCGFSRLLLYFLCIFVKGFILQLPAPISYSTVLSCGKRGEDGNNKKK